MGETMRLRFSVPSLVACALVLGAVVFIHPASANCSFSGGEGNGGVVTFQLPAVIAVAPDAPVGTVIYDGSVESNEITVDCGGTDAQIRRGYLSITSADARETSCPAYTEPTCRESGSALPHPRKSTPAIRQAISCARGSIWEPCMVIRIRYWPSAPPRSCW